jgi:hypothetical protein
MPYQARRRRAFRLAPTSPEPPGQASVSACPPRCPEFPRPTHVTRSYCVARWHVMRTGTPRCPPSCVTTEDVPVASDRPVNAGNSRSLPDSLISPGPPLIGAPVAVAVAREPQTLLKTTTSATVPAGLRATLGATRTTLHPPQRWGAGGARLNNDRCWQVRLDRVAGLAHGKACAGPPVGYRPGARRSATHGRSRLGHHGDAADCKVLRGRRCTD